jgi:hypothetical protein
MSRTSRWLARDLLVGPYLILCLSEQDYRKAVKTLKVPGAGQWLKTPQADATAHTFENVNDGDLAAVVCLKLDDTRTGIEVAGLLTHEAVHVWQQFREWIGEDKPGDEAEAYAIQRISQRLWCSYVEQTS